MLVGLSLGKTLVRLSQDGRLTTEDRIKTLREAEELLQKAHESLANRPDTPLLLRTKLLEGFAELYDAWDAAEPGEGYAAKAAKWRARLPESMK